MSRGRERDRTAVVEVLRAGIGVAHLIGAQRASGRVAVFGRVLGVRQLVQAGLVARAASPEAHTLSAAVDAAHGLSMVPLLALDRRSRPFAARQVWIALLLTVLEIGLVGTGRRRH